MTEILLVRHGRTTANAEGLLLGRLDPDLDAEGDAQAAAVAALLAAELAGRALRIVSSPLRRTAITAAAIADALGGVDVEIDERWIELDYGELDGVPLADVPAETWATWRTDAEFCPEAGSASRPSAAGCGRPATTWRRRRGTVVVVSHVSPIKAAVAWALGVGISSPGGCTSRPDRSPGSRSTPGPVAARLQPHSALIAR